MARPKKSSVQAQEDRSFASVEVTDGSVLNPPSTAGASNKGPALVNDYGLTPSENGEPYYTYVVDESIVVSNNDSMPTVDKPLAAYSLNDVIDHLSVVAGLTPSSGQELRGLILDYIVKALRDPRGLIAPSAGEVTGPSVSTSKDGAPARPLVSFDKPPALQTRLRRSPIELEAELRDPERVRAAMRLLSSWQRRKDVIVVEDEVLEQIKAARSLVGAYNRRHPRNAKPKTPKTPKKRGPKPKALGPK